MIGNRSINVDFLTALFILMVLFLHHDSFTVNYFPSYITQNDYLQTFAVGGFIFLSGYKLALSRKNQSFWQFWKRRLIRIYPLYLIAVGLFSQLIHTDSSIKNVMAHLLGMQILFPRLFGDNFLTLYYVGLILLYYLIFSLTKQYLPNMKRFLYIQTVIICASYGLHLWRPGGVLLFDSVYFRYYPFYIAGILTAVLNIRLLSIGIVAANIIYSLAILNLDYLIAGLNLRMMLYAPLYFFLYNLLSQVSVSRRIAGLFSLIAMASYPVYLFHRPFWTLITMFINKPSLEQWIAVIVVGIPFLLVVGYKIQVGYNALVSYCSLRILLTERRLVLKWRDYR